MTIAAIIYGGALLILLIALLLDVHKLRHMPKASRNYYVPTPERDTAEVEQVEVEDVVLPGNIEATLRKLEGR